MKTIRNQLCWLFLVSTMFICAGCISIVRFDGPYEGKVIDAETNQPLEGAVVHGSWYKAHLGAGGASHTFYDSYETLTDKNGDFRIPGQGLLLFTMTEEINFTIFKAGYEQFPKGSPWSGLKDWGINDKITWKGNKATFKLKRLTLQERRDRYIEFPVIEPNNKQRLLRMESNKENTEIGRALNTILPLE